LIWTNSKLSPAYLLSRGFSYYRKSTLLIFWQMRLRSSHIGLVISLLFLLGHSLWPHAHRLCQSDPHFHAVNFGVESLADALSLTFATSPGEGHLDHFQPAEEDLFDCELPMVQMFSPAEDWLKPIEQASFTYLVEPPLLRPGLIDHGPFALRGPPLRA